MGALAVDPGRAGLAQRARIVLLATDGAGTNEIVAGTGQCHGLKSKRLGGGVRAVVTLSDVRRCG